MSTAPDSKPKTAVGGCLLTALIAGVVSAVVSLGMSLLVGLLLIPLVHHGFDSPIGLGEAMEEGTVDVTLEGNTYKGGAKVYYRKPFATPPHLTFPSGLPSGCTVDEQQPDSFSIKRDMTGFYSYETVARVQWKAEGMPSP